jgi:hypothetical protein
MSYTNGRLPQSVLAPITRAANGQQAYLLASAAHAFNAMNAESEHRFGVTLRVSSARVAYRPYSDQEYFWDQYLHYGGALAARPGYSNHGWGLAIDLATPQMRAIVDKIGAKYGWAKAWSDAPSEWWHIKYRPGVWNGKAAYASSSDPVLRQGQKGRSVIKLKQLLYAKGMRNFSGAKSSNRYNPFFGKYTKATVKRFQKAHHLTADGIVGASTWKVLRK